MFGAHHLFLMLVIACKLAMILFAQDTFAGGLNTSLDASKLPVSQYPLLFNGRITANTIKPTKEHKPIGTPPGTNRQGLYAIGKLLVLFTDGLAFWADTEVDEISWTAIPGWSAMSATAARIYAESIPVSYFQGSIAYDTTNTDLSQVRSTFPGTVAQTPGHLFVTDGETQPRVVDPSGSFRFTSTWADWSITNPEYVPVCILPKRSGSKLYVVDPINKNQIYHSVSGRYLDFVINRTADGNKGSTAADCAKSTAKAVDYNQITALFPFAGNSSYVGGLMVSTLYSSYVVLPDYNNKFFGEPLLPDGLLFPTGAVNDRSFADLNGDIAFITQLGIQSFNITKQFASESNNFPLGASIAKILVNPQQDTCATNFGTDALFSVKTVYGYAVLIFDNILQAFVSIDLGFGQVTDFAVTKWNGVQKLFFLTADGSVFQAYAADNYATCRVYLGEYTTYESESGKQVPGIQHKVNGVRLQFGNVREDTTVQLSVHGDNKLLKTEVREIEAYTYPEIIPYPLPYPAVRQSMPVDFMFKTGAFVWKTGLLLEWNGGAELLAISVEGETAVMDSWARPGVTATNSTIVTVFGDNAFGNEVSPGIGSMGATGLTIGAWYSIVGEVHLGGKIVQDTIFKATATEVIKNGELRLCGDVKTVWDLMVADNPTKILGVGDHAMSSGTSIEVRRILTVVDTEKLAWIPGNHDLVTLGGRYFYNVLPSLPNYKVTVGIVDFFLMNSGPIGDESPFDTDWLAAELAASTNGLKVVLMHKPPYTDDVSYTPGYVALRVPFKRWGANMVISGHAHAYQRFSITDIPYVVLGPSGSGVRGLAPANNYSVMRASSAGYLRLTIKAYSMLCEFVGIDGVVLDAFAIYS